MAISELFASKGERQNIIGQVDCTSEKVSDVFVGLMQSTGMANPSSSTTTSSKGVTVSKRGNKYTLVLGMYTPPIKIEWTDAVQIQNIIKLIDDLAASKKRAGWINIIKLNSGSQLVQLAIG